MCCVEKEKPDLAAMPEDGRKRGAGKRRRAIWPA